MIVLDTHAWIWYSNESPELPKTAFHAIHQADTLGVSAISCWEVAMLVAKQRLGLAMDVEDWINLAFERAPMRLLPMSPKIAVLSTRLPGDFHGDPADRIIAATCLAHHAPMITKDQQIHEWGQIQTIWS
jgi:PIN domain nuclease of toxin-antitoxin system